MKLCFDSIDEVKDFVKQLKGTRSGKGDATDEAIGTAPAPLQPSTTAGFNPTAQAGFVPPGAGAGQPAMGFPAAGATAGPGPEVLALAQRISARIDWAITPAASGGGGQDPNAIATWFRSQLGPEAASYTLDQIKHAALPRAAMPVLETIAKLMAA